MSDISVIIPAYNRAELIGETLRSLLNQTVPAKEIIVVMMGRRTGRRKSQSGSFQFSGSSFQENPTFKTQHSKFCARRMLDLGLRGNGFKNLARMFVARSAGVSLGSLQALPNICGANNPLFDQLSALKFSMKRWGN